MTLNDLRIHIAERLCKLEDELHSFGLGVMTRFTLIARDPNNDEMLVCVTNDEPLEDAFEAVLKHGR